MTQTLTSEQVRLAEVIYSALPQTQCTRCGYIDCLSYAQALATGDAQINQCPPGGAEGMHRLALITGLPPMPLNPVNGLDGPRQLAVIDEAWCIGCTLCIKACPVDCIVGANKQMHVIVDQHCTGCELCVPACPVDCISLLSVTPGRTGWQAWTDDQASQARGQYEFRQFRLGRARVDQAERLLHKAESKLADVASASRLTDPEQLDKKRAVIEAAIARARGQRSDR